MSAFFIDRPVFAWVVAILILLGGGVATRYLAVEQYPNVAPPAGRHQRQLPGR
ncbi:TPA: efflux RND transporter permease subunit, partial [Pseudomonas aeruginosa]